MKAFEQILTFSLGVFLLFGMSICAAITSVSGSCGVSTAHPVYELCSPIGTSGPCQSVPNHLDMWQVIFTAIPVLISFLALLAILRFSRWVDIFHTRKRYAKEVRAPIEYVSRSRLLPRTPLQEAFSNGILHSKLFSY